MRVAAIMPCRGRAEQTVRNVRRLLATAGAVEWQLICMIDRDPGLDAVLSQLDLPIWRMGSQQRGYWHALQQATEYWPEFGLLVNLANDLLPGQHWLQRAVAAYQQTFGDGPGLVGFNDGHHETGHSCHFLISRSLLDRYGGWPVWYQHDYGDTEICQRAIADGLYVKAPWATLYHDHPFFGAENMDAVYHEGRASSEADRQTYESRRKRGWPTISR